MFTTFAYISNESFRSRSVPKRAKRNARKKKWLHGDERIPGVDFCSLKFKYTRIERERDERRGGEGGRFQLKHSGGSLFREREAKG